MSAAAEFRKKLEAYAAKHAINDIESRVRTAVIAGNADKANRLRNESMALMKRAVIGGRLDEQPAKRSLGLLPSGPDPVGEGRACRQPPSAVYGR